ncbi:predicted protein [Uncinocarpus reesii 1704]|uniref:Uncharacterized protein n=1 Tax=Uncinocarpus reesii (strain UAMH 1704) TaxID=336963 RepID=C4RRN0_UNCRE|nr:uncharacterized protein UREG_07929 [Uncinocarpus reesii 1704]EEP83064.1 predicted protein [Uncinocarpus reesii 1704]
MELLGCESLAFLRASSLWQITCELGVGLRHRPTVRAWKLFYAWANPANAAIPAHMEVAAIDSVISSKFQHTHEMPVAKPRMEEAFKHAPLLFSGASGFGQKSQNIQRSMAPGEEFLKMSFAPNVLSTLSPNIIRRFRLPKIVQCQ